MIYSLILIFNLFSAMTSLTYDFGEGKDGKDWMIVNDGVMGGLSSGKVTFTETSLVFSGSVSLENNGGFTSFRAPYGRYNLEPFDKIEIRYRLTGLDCALSIDQNRRFWRPNYKMPIPTNDNWRTLTVNLYELGEYQMGRKTGRQMSTDEARNSIRLGIITDSKEAGDFRLEVDYIKFYRSDN